MADKKDATDDNFDLKGRLLLAMPGMGDARFHKAAILVCAHDKNGAMGLVINHTLPGIDIVARTSGAGAIPPPRPMRATSSHAQ